MSIINSNKNDGGGISLPISIEDVTGLRDALNSMQNSIVKLSKKRIFQRSWATSTAGSIVAGITPTTTPIRILDRLTYNQISGIEPNTPDATFEYTSGVNSFIKENNDPDYPDKDININLRFRKLAGSMGTTQIECAIYRQSDNSVVGAPFTESIANANFRGFNIPIDTRSYDSTDAFVTNGYYIGIRNLSTTVLTYEAIELLIKVRRDVGYP